MQPDGAAPTWPDAGQHVAVIDLQSLEVVGRTTPADSPMAWPGYDGNGGSRASGGHHLVTTTDATTSGPPDDRTIREPGSRLDSTSALSPSAMPRATALWTSST